MLGEKPGPVALSRLNLLNGLFLSCCPKCAFLMSLIISACAAHVILPDFISILISSKEYGIWSSSLCNNLQQFAPSSLLARNTILSILFQNNLSPYIMNFCPMTPPSLAGWCRYIGEWICRKYVPPTHIYSHTGLHNVVTQRWQQEMWAPRKPQTTRVQFTCHCVVPLLLTVAGLWGRVLLIRILVAAVFFHRKLK